MRYHQVNDAGEIMTGTCQSSPEILNNGKIRLHETWQMDFRRQISRRSILKKYNILTSPVRAGSVFNRNIRLRAKATAEPEIHTCLMHTTNITRPKTCSRTLSGADQIFH